MKEVINKVDASHMDRLDTIAELIICGKPKRNIIKQVMNDMQCSKSTALTLYKEAVIMMTETSPLDKQEFITVNLARLDDLYSQCNKIGDKLKAIDLVNKTLGIYETNINLGNKEESFKFDIGVSDNE